MSAGITLLFSASGRAKNSCALWRRASMTTPGTPCPVMVKNPISRQIRSMSRPVSRRAIGSPDKAAARSTTGMPASMILMPSVEIGAAIDHDGLAGDEAGIGAGEKGHGPHQVPRCHVACQNPGLERRLAHALLKCRILPHAVAQGEAGSDAVDQDAIAAKLAGQRTGER